MLTIRKRDPAKRMARFYRLALQRALPLSAETDSNPEPVDLVREWGRIGSSGTVRIDGFRDETEAHDAGVKLASQKQRKGYR